MTTAFPLDQLRVTPQRAVDRLCRVHFRGDLLGTIHPVQARGPRGARLTHWQAHPAAMAWTHGIIGAPRPAPDVLTPLPVREQRDEAITGLVEYLRGVGAPAVAALYEER